MTKKKTTKEKTRKAILDLLKKEGGKEAGKIAERFQLTPMAVRLQLYDLRDHGFVVDQSESRPKGRPVKMWTLTEKADRFFPDMHSDLLLDILDSVEESFGSEMIETLAFSRGKKQLSRYKKELEDKENLFEKLEALARLRTQEGYMAEVQGAGSGFLFLENHCPICAAATRCRGFCASELEIFRELIGDGFSVERINHILAGERRCAYTIEPKERD